MIKRKEKNYRYFYSKTIKYKQRMLNKNLKYIGTEIIKVFIKFFERYLKL